MCRTIRAAVVTLIVGSLFSACSSEPNVGGPEHRAVLHDQVRATLDDFRTTDPSLQHLFDSAYAYVVFPEVVTAAVGVGGAHGPGEVYQGQFVGYADVSQGSIGAQLGAEKYAEIIFFENESSFLDFKNGSLAFDARATATAAAKGAAATANYQRGVVVFTRPIGGLMAQAAIGGQKFRFEAADQPTR